MKLSRILIAAALVLVFGEPAFAQEKLPDGTKVTKLATGLPGRPMKLAPAAAPERTRPKASTGGGASVATASENARRLMSTTVEQAMAQAILFAGAPDSVFAQLKRFHDDVGGFGHLTMIGRTGYMTHAESEKSIRLFGKEVLPRLKEIAPLEARAAAQ